MNKAPFRFSNLINFGFFTCIAFLFQARADSLPGLVQVALSLDHAASLVSMSIFKVALPLFNAFLMTVYLQLPIWFLQKRNIGLIQALKPLYALLFSLGFFVLFVDFQIYSNLKIHLSDPFIATTFESDLLKDIGLATEHILFLFFSFVCVFGFELGLLWLGQKPFWTGFHLRSYQYWKRQAYLFSVLPLMLIFLSFHRYQDADLFQKLTQHQPLVFPLNSGKFLNSLWNTLDIKQKTSIRGSSNLRHNYFKFTEHKGYQDTQEELLSRKEFQIKNKWNILFIVCESLRFDLLDPDIMPNLSRLVKDKGAPLPYHYSTGNSTTEGLFGLFYGQTPLYWYMSKKDKVNPPLFHILKQAGYTNKIFSTSKLTFRSVRKYIFAKNIDHFYFFNKTWKKKFKGQSKRRNRLEQDDVELLNNFFIDLDKNEPGPRMDFLFFYSTHYNYYYPPEFEKFTPVDKNKTVSVHRPMSKKRARKLFNRYKNAAFFLDDLLGQIVKKLEEKNLLEKTVIVFTGDHGEEFYEYGRLSHSMSLFKYQTQVPLFLHIPTPKSPIQYSITSHADIVPSILDAMETNIDINKYFSGKSLYQYNPNRNLALIVSARRREAPHRFLLVKDKFKISFTNRPYDTIPRKTYTFDTEKITPISKKKLKQAIQALERQKTYFH